MVYGKVPPQAKNLEEAILGAIMLAPESIDRVVGILSPEMFYVDAHQRVYRAMLELNSISQPVDMFTVTQSLIKSGELESVGGAYFVSKLTDKVVAASNIEVHSRIVCEKFLQREMIRIGGDIVQAGYDESLDVFDALDKAEEQILSIGKKHVYGDVKTIDNVLMRTIQRIEEWRQSPTHVTGIPTGSPQLDRATRGWQNTDLIILAARPSVGKTAYAIKLIRTAVFNPIRPVKVGVWSLEMEDVQLVLRMLSSESEIPLHRLQTGRVTDEEMQTLHKKAIHKLSQAGIFIDDEADMNITRFRAKARRLKKKHDIGLILLDYLQLMSGDEKNREREIAKISRGLKLLAKELKIPVIALSQLSREVEKRSGTKKIPQLSDLRESGAIEQDADMVIFLWGPDEDEIANDASLLNRRYARIAKQRSGMLLTVDFEFNKDIQEWTELSQQAPPQIGPGAWKPVSSLPYADDKDEPF